MALPRPRVSAQQALNLATKLYSLVPRSTSVVTELESYEDRNFLLQTQIAAHGQVEKETKFVLKVMNPVTSLNKEALTLNSKLLLVLNGKGVQCPRPQLSIYGKYVTLCRFPKIREQESSKWRGEEDFQVVDSTELPRFEGGLRVSDSKRNHFDDNFEIYAVRLFSFLPGKLLCDVKLTVDVLFKFGLEVGKLHKVMKEFSQTSDFRDSHFMPSASDWHLVNSPTLFLKYSHVIEDESRRALVSDIGHHFQKEVIPKIEQIETQVIHGDLNEHNVIVEESADGQVDFKGFIDFGDMDVSCRALDIAIAVAYIMIEAIKQGVNAKDAVGHMMKGYQAVFPLSSLEREIVLEGAKTRICHSLIMGAYSYKYLAPDNDYLLYTAKEGWKALDQLVQTPSEDIYSIWFSS